MKPDDDLTLASGADEEIEAWLAAAETSDLRETVGLEWREVRPGRTSQLMTLQPTLCDDQGVPGVGTLAILVDSTVGTAIATSVSPPSGTVSISMHIDVLRDLPQAGGRIRADATSSRSDGRMALGRALLSVDGGTLAEASLQAVLGTMRGRSAPRHTRNVGAADDDHRPSPHGPVDRFLNLSVQPADWSRPETVQMTAVVPTALRSGWKMLHGGTVGLLTERAAARVLGEALENRPSYRPLAFDIRWFRPVPAGQVLHLTSRIVSAGRSLATARCELFLPDGRIASAAELTVALDDGLGPA